LLPQPFEKTKAEPSTGEEPEIIVEDFEALDSREKVVCRENSPSPASSCPQSGLS